MDCMLPCAVLIVCTLPTLLPSSISPVLGVTDFIQDNFFISSTYYIVMMITFQLFWTDKDHSGAHALSQWALSIAPRLPNSEMLGNPLSMTSQIGSNYFLPARSLQVLEPWI